VEEETIGKRTEKDFAVKDILGQQITSANQQRHKPADDTHERSYRGGAKRTAKLREA
jgi:hypothetical protein